MHFVLLGKAETLHQLEINCIRMEMSNTDYCILSLYEWGGKDVLTIQNFTAVTCIFMKHTAHCF
jgi:hypothetical protein